MQATRATTPQWITRYTRNLTGGGFLYHGLAALITLWAARILVAGSYYSMWDLLWYGKALPGIAPLAAFILAMPLARGSWPRILLLPLAGAVLAFGDDVRMLAVPAALAAAAGASLLQSSRGRLLPALALGMSLDLPMHVAARGIDPVEYLPGRLILAGAAIILALWGPEGEYPSFRLTAVITALELGLAYPSALLHYTGHEAYSLGLYAATGFLAVLALLIGGLLARLHRDTPVLVVLVFAGMVLEGDIGLSLVLLSLAGLGALLVYERGGSRLGALAGGVWLVLAGFLGVAVYTYPYVGLWFMADRMELVLLAAMVAAAAAGWPSEDEYSEIAMGEIVVGARELSPVALGVLALALSMVLQAPPVNVQPGESGVVDAYTLNLHQGYDWRGRLNGREAASLIVGAVAGGGVVCLQEVDAGRLTSMYVDMPLALQSRGVVVAYQPAIEGTYGVAIAGPRGLEKVGGVLLPSTGEQRAAVKANASGIIAVSAHLGLDPGERTVQAQALVDYALKMPEALLLCGDFNEPGGAALDYISRYYTIAWPPGATCCLGTGENTTIDFIAVREGRATVEEVNVVPAPSDHMMVHARIRLLEG